MYNEFFPWKCLLYRENMEAVLDGNFEPPPILHVYPTNDCNNDCRFCIMKQERNNGGSLSRDAFERLIQDANNMGIECIHISGGGEPTMYPHLDLVEKFNGFKVLSSNGRELSKQTASLFNRIRISINAGSSQVYEDVNGTKDFWKLELRLITLSENRDYELGLGYVADYSNWWDIPKACMIADQHNMDFVHIRPAYYPKGIHDDLTQHVSKSVHYISESCKQVFDTPIYSISDKFDGYWTKRTYNKCRATPLHAVVTATGQMSVCQDNFIKFGNIETDSIINIWGSQEHKDAISKIDIDECPRCVMNKPNEVIEHVIMENKIRRELL